MEIHAGLEYDYPALDGNNFRLADFGSCLDTEVIEVDVYRTNGGPALAEMRLCVADLDTDPLTCDLVPNPDFATTDNWLLAGTASITSSELSLATDDAAAQNLTLASQTTYNAVISVTNVTAPTDLVVALGVDARIISISSAGQYTSVFTTGNLFGPVSYSLDNTSGGTIDIGYTCLALAGSGPGGDQYTCIPDNGDFELASSGSYPLAASWNFHQGASWNSASRDVHLPFDDNQNFSGLIQSSTTYQLPTPGAGEYLIFSYDARADDDTGILGGSLYDDPGLWFETFVEVYPTFYTYEFDVSSMASSYVEVLFNNPGYDPVTETALAANITLDNVCIFVADRPPQLPFATDPNTYTPVSIVGEFSCDLVDSYLAYWGVNIQQHRAIYEYDFSILDSIQWLVSAFWVILAMYLCFFVGAVWVLLDMLEYILNNGINYGNWLVLSALDFPTWLAAVVNWLLVSWGNLMDWWGDSWLATVLWLLLMLSNPILFILSLPEIFTSVLNWLANDGLAQMVRSLENAIYTIVNSLIYIWNDFLPALGVIISEALNVLLGIWNDSIHPVLQLLLALINPFSAIFVILDLVWVIGLWLWENAITVLYIPVEFFQALNDGVSSPGYDLYSCNSGNLWCYLFAGLDMINQTASHPFLYPAVIVLIIIGTIVLLRDTLVQFYEFVLNLAREL